VAGVKKMICVFCGGELYSHRLVLFCKECGKEQVFKK